MVWSPVRASDAEWGAVGRYLTMVIHLEQQMNRMLTEYWSARDTLEFERVWMKRMTLGPKVELLRSIPYLASGLEAPIWVGGPNRQQVLKQHVEIRNRLAHQLLGVRVLDYDSYLDDSPDVVHTVRIHGEEHAVEAKLPELTHEVRAVGAWLHNEWIRHRPDGVFGVDLRDPWRQ